MVSVTDLIKDLTVAIPSIAAATMTITSTLNGVFKIENTNVKHILSWVVAVIGGVVFVFSGGLTFGLEPWMDYVLGALCGLCVGAMSNGIFDWPAVEKVFDALTAICTLTSKVPLGTPENTAKEDTPEEDTPEEDTPEDTKA